MIDPFLSAIPWSGIGWSGIVVVGVISLMRGWIVPKSQVDKLLTVHQERLADKDKQIAELKATNDAIDRRNDMLANQVRELVQVGHTSNAALQALPLPGRENVI